MYSSTSSGSWKEDYNDVRRKGQQELSALQAAVERAAATVTHQPGGNITADAASQHLPAGHAAHPALNNATEPSHQEKWHRVAQWVEQDSCTAAEAHGWTAGAQPKYSLDSQSESLSLDSLLESAQQEKRQVPGVHASAAGPPEALDFLNRMLRAQHSAGGQDAKHGYAAHQDMLLPPGRSSPHASGYMPPAAHLAQVAVLEGRVAAAEEEMLLLKQHWSQDLERAQHLHTADQQRASLRLAAAEEALTIERQLNQHLKQQLQASEERTRSVIETEGRARHAEVSTLQQMYGHAAQALEAERKRASEAVAAAMHDAKSEHAGRLLKLEQERSAAISALEDENVQLRLELGNQLADANAARASLAAKAEELEAVVRTLEREAADAQIEISSLQQQLEQGAAKEQEAREQLDQAYYEVSKMRDELQMLTARLTTRDLALQQHVQEVERQHVELHASQMADAAAAYALLRKALAAVHGSLSPEALAGTFQFRPVDDANAGSAWRPDVAAFAAPLCTDQEAFARLEARLAGAEAVQPEDASAVLHRVQEVMECAQLTVTALNSCGGALADSYQHEQADLAAAVDDLRAKLASSQGTSGVVESLSKKLEAAESHILELQQQELQWSQSGRAALQATIEGLQTEMAQQLAHAERLTAEVALWQQRSEAAEAKAADLENRLACSDNALAQMEQLAKAKEERIKELRSAMNYAMDGRSSDTQQLKDTLQQHKAKFAQLKEQHDQAAKTTAALEAAIEQEKQRADELLSSKEAADRRLAELQQQCSGSQEEVCSCRDELLRSVRELLDELKRLPSDGSLLDGSSSRGATPSVTSASTPRQGNTADAAATPEALALRLQQHIQLLQQDSTLAEVSAACQLATQCLAATMRHGQSAAEAAARSMRAMEQIVAGAAVKVEGFAESALASSRDEPKARALKEALRLSRPLDGIQAAGALAAVVNVVLEIATGCRQEQESISSKSHSLDSSLAQALHERDAAARRAKDMEGEAAASRHQLEQIKVTAQQQWAKLHSEVSTLLQAADAARQDAVNVAERTKQDAKQQLQDADAKLAAAQTASQELEQKAEVLQQQVAQLEAELESVQAAHAQDESSLARSEQRCSSLSDELATATSEAAAFQQQCSALQLALAAAKEEVVRLQPKEQPWVLERRGLAAQVAALKAKKTAMVKQLVAERRLRTRTEQVLQGHRASQAALQARLQKAAAAGERSASSAAELEGKAQRAEQLAARLDERRIVLEADKRKLNERIAKLQEQLVHQEKVSHDLSRAAATSTQLQHSLAAKEEMLDTLVRQLEQAEFSLRSSQAAANQLLQDKQSLHARQADLEAQRDVAHRELDSITTQHLQLEGQLQQLIALLSHDRGTHPSEAPAPGATWDALVAQLQQPNVPLLQLVRQLQADDTVQALVRSLAAHLAILLAELQDLAATRAAAMEHSDALVKQLGDTKDQEVDSRASPATGAKLDRIQELRSALASNVQQKQELLDAMEVMKAQLSVQSRLGGADSEKLQATEQQLAELHQELHHTKAAQSAAESSLEVLAEQLQQTKQLASTWQQEVEKLQWQLQQDTSTLLKQVGGLQLEAEHSRTELQQLQAMLTGQSAGEQLQTLQHELLLSMQREKAIKEAWQASETEQAAALERMDATWADQEHQLHALIEQLQGQVQELSRGQDLDAAGQVQQQRDIIQELAAELAALKEALQQRTEETEFKDRAMQDLQSQHSRDVKHLQKQLNVLEEELQQAQHLLTRKEAGLQQQQQGQAELSSQHMRGLLEEHGQARSIAAAAASSAELEAVTQRCSELEAQLQDTTSKANHLEEAGEQLRAQLRTAEQLMLQNRDALRLQQDYCTSEKAAAAAVADELAACQEGSRKLQAALHSAHGQIQALSADSKAFQGSLQERAALQAQIHQLEQQLDEALSKASSSSVLQLQLRQLQGDVQAKIAALQEKEELVQRQQGVLEQLRHERHHLQAALEAAQEAEADTAQWRHELLVQQQYTAQLEATLAATSRSHQAETAGHHLQTLQEDVQRLQMRITLLQQENADLEELLHQKEQGHSAQLQAVQGSQQQAAASSSLNSVQASQLSAIVAENQDLVQRLAAMHGRLKGLRAQLSSKEAEVDQKEAKIKQLQARMRGPLHQGSGISSAGNPSQQASPPGSVASFEAASSMASAKWQGPPTASGAERGEGDDEFPADDYPAVPQHMSMLEAVQLQAERDAFKGGMAAAREEAALSSAAAAEAQAQVQHLRRAVEDLRHMLAIDRASTIQAATDTAGSSTSSAGPTSESHAAPELQVQGLQRKLQQLMGALEEAHAAYTAVCRDRDHWQEQLVSAQSQARQLELQSQDLSQALSAAQAAIKDKDALVQQLATALERQQRADSNDGHGPGSDAASSRSYVAQSSSAHPSRRGRLEEIVAMWKESCKLKDAQIADLESNLGSANAMLDGARSEARELQRRCVEGDQKLSGLLATEKLAREELQGQLKTARAEVAASEAQLAAADAELQASRSQSRALERQLEALHLDLQAARQEATAASSASAAAGDSLAEAQAALAAQRRANEGLQRDARAASAKAAEASRQLQNRDGDVMVLCEAVRDVLVGVRSKYNHPFDWSLGGQGSAGGSPLQHLRQLVDVLAAEVASRHAELEKASGEVGKLEAALQEKQELAGEQDLKLRAQTDKIFQQQAQLQQRGRELETAQGAMRRREQDWSHVEKELLALRRECDQLRDRLTVQQQQQAASSGETQELAGLRDKLQARLAAKAEEGAAAANRLAAMQKQLQVQHSTQAVLQERLDSLEAQLAAAQDDQARAAMAKQEAVARQELAESELEAARLQLLFKEEALQKRIHEVREMNAMLKAWEAMRLGKDAQISALMERSKRQEEEAAEKARTVEALRRKLAAATGRRSSGGSSSNTAGGRPGTAGSNPAVSSGTSTSGVAATQQQQQQQRYLHLHVHSPQQSTATSTASFQLQGR